MEQNDNKYKNGEYAQPLDEQTLQRFIDGRLDATEQQALQKRLKRDATSRRRLDALREEDRLIGHALEALSEPPVKISEKVMTVLYAEFNKRQQHLRARRFRRRLFTTLSAAAVLMLTVMFIQPRPPAGVYVSGRGTLDQSTKGQISFDKGVHFFEGDILKTGMGQFMRVRLSEGSLVELGEFTQLKIARFKDQLVRTELESGRVRVLVSDQNQEFVVRALKDEVRAAPGASMDLRMARLVNAVWPHWAEPFQAMEQGPGPTRERSPACLFVSKGQAELVIRKSGQAPVVISDRQLICFGRNRKPTSPLRLGAIPFGQEDRWFEENSIPQDRAQLGLLEPIAWDKMSARMGLKNDLPGGQTAAEEMAEVFKEFDSANAIIDASARAEALGKGLLRLRSAAERLVLRDARRWRERTIEGLVHYERGRALLATANEKSQAAARDAFLDACIAFEEALAGGDEEGGANSDQDPSQGHAEKDSVRAPGLATLSAPKIEKHTRLSDLSPDEEAYLFALFYKPWAEYHLMQTVRLAGSDDAGLASEERDPAGGFKKAEAVLGRSVEILASRYGLGMALEQAGQLEKAEATFRDLESTSVAGHDSASRACAEGLRQAALVKLDELFSRHGDRAKLQNTLDVFRLRYPLDTNTRAGIAMRSIEKQKTR